MAEPLQTAPEETAFCEPHWERNRIRVPAAKTVDGTPMCADCFSGVPTDPQERDTYLMARRYQALIKEGQNDGS